MGQQESLEIFGKRDISEFRYREDREYRLIPGVLSVGRICLLRERMPQAEYRYYAVDLVVKIESLTEEPGGYRLHAGMWFPHGETASGLGLPGFKIDDLGLMESENPALVGERGYLLEMNTWQDIGLAAMLRAEEAG